MSSQSVEIDFNKASKILDSLWEEVTKIPEEELDTYNYVDDKDLRAKIKELVNSKTKSYRYAIITQLLAKKVNPNINCLSIQAQASIEGAFDARSLCREVLVNFERRKLSDALGGSPDPYVNKPLRHARFSLEKETLRHIKDKRGWNILCQVLNYVEKKNDPKLTEKLLKQALLEARKRYLKIPHKLAVKKPPFKIDIPKLKEILEKFLSKPSGGARCQSVIYALIKVFNERVKAFEEITTAKSTAANSFTGRLADIECRDKDGALKLAIAATEELTLGKLDEELSKAAKRNISRIFVVAHKIRIKPDQAQSLIDEYITKHGMDIVMVSLINLVIFMTTLLNDELRLKFLNEVSQALQEMEYYDDLEDWKNVLEEKGVSNH
ncbi:restriction endonuclease, SacI family [Candidatus Bathyarchaeota archaeon]|nr:restriction endonuclease, SacI family [Candidatus Bathyarchaeota archaeon]